MKRLLSKGQQKDFIFNYKHKLSTDNVIKPQTSTTYNQFSLITFDNVLWTVITQILL